jgi:CBS domain-containing protein
MPAGLEPPQEERRGAMQVADFLRQSRPPLVICLPDDPLHTVANAMYANNIGAMPVCEAGTRMVGIVSERDLVRAFARPDWSELQYLRARDVMTTRVTTCKPDDSMQSAQEVMRTNRFRHLPVLDGSKLVGILSLRDTLALRLHESQEEVNLLRDLALAGRH